MNENRDKSILAHIIQYCNQINEAIEIFGNDYGIFFSSNTYRNACCLCLLQIGELAGTLSDNFSAARIPQYCCPRLWHNRACSCMGHYIQ